MDSYRQKINLAEICINIQKEKNQSMGEYHNSVKPQIIQELICPFSVEKKKNGQCRVQQRIPRRMHWAGRTHGWPVTSIDPQNNDWRIINLRTKTENYDSNRSLRVLIEFSLFLPVSCIYEIPWKRLKVTPTAEASAGC